ncbi:major facilitator superfamily domain-containing protein [Mycena olivaceomarginata]|nr:major facilitator superfamily domain-containing protein [Mycena olivaceomarginata]
MPTGDTMTSTDKLPASDLSPHAFEDPKGSLDSEIPTKPAPKSRAFWLSFVAIMAAEFLSALDLTAVGTALPTIAGALSDTEGDYIWVGSAYALSSTAFIPLSGNPRGCVWASVMLASIAFFVLGSAIAGAAQNMPMMIAARVIQGTGGGGILTLTEIIIADLVPLAERGLYNGLVAIVWALASFSGPPISLIWFEDLNLPVGAIAFATVFFFLSVRRPEGSTREKLAKVDWVYSSQETGLANVGLSWAGIRYAWSSVQVLAPLVIGLVLLVIFAIYEAKFAGLPAIPRDIVGNRTSLSALLTTVTHGIISIGMVFYLPVFFQACFSASPLRSAVDFLPAAITTTPFGFIGVVAITLTKKYRIVNWISWAITIVGFGLFSTIREDTSVGKWVGYQIVLRRGCRPSLWSAYVSAAGSLAKYPAPRTWGITIASTILQNSLKKNLPAAFVAQFPPNFEIAYAAIPVIRTLEEPLKTQVRAAFADSMAVIWQTMIGFAGLGLLFSFLMKEVPMDTTVDEKYTLKEKEARQPEYRFNTRTWFELRFVFLSVFSKPCPDYARTTFQCQLCGERQVLPTDFLAVPTFADPDAVAQ